MTEYAWADNADATDWDELANLYRIPPLGNKSLKTVFASSMFKRFVYAGGILIGAGRALADGLDCAYIADVAVHSDHRGRGLGKAIIRQLVALLSARYDTFCSDAPTKSNRGARPAASSRAR